jgi:predicted NBD/HSP70 family sugar kinase
VTPFEEVMTSELAWLLRVGVPARTIRLTVRELMVEQITRGPVGAREVSEAVAAVARAACRMVQEMNAPEEVIGIVCGAAFESVRGHGGESARWVVEAMHTAATVLEEEAEERAEDPTWRWLVQRGPRW